MPNTQRKMLALFRKLMLSKEPLTHVQMADMCRYIGGKLVFASNSCDIYSFPEDTKEQIKIYRPNESGKAYAVLHIAKE